MLRSERACGEDAWRADGSRRGRRTGLRGVPAVWQRSSGHALCSGAAATVRRGE